MPWSARRRAASPPMAAARQAPRLTPIDLPIQASSPKAASIRIRWLAWSGHLPRRRMEDSMTAQTDAATLFRRLHQGPALLILANAWDAGSARLIESLGAPAIATTSAGVAWALGYRD